MTAESNESDALSRVATEAQALAEAATEDISYRKFIFEKLQNAVDQLAKESRQSSSNAESLPESQFLQATADMRGAYLLMQAAKTVETGDPAPVKEALSQLQAEAQEQQAIQLNFEADLLEQTNIPADAGDALKLFQERSVRTLNNMITDARDVISLVIDKFKDKFDDFIGALGDAAQSIAATGKPGLLQRAAEMAVSGLKSLAEFLKNDALQSAIERLREIVKGLKLEDVLAYAFQAKKTEAEFQEIKLRPTTTASVVNGVIQDLTDLAKRFVVLMKRAQWVVKAIPVIGGLLVFTGIGAHYAALGVPIAYAIVAAAVIIIGMDFADVGPVDLVPGIRSLLNRL